MVINLTVYLVVMALFLNDRLLCPVYAWVLIRPKHLDANG